MFKVGRRDEPIAHGLNELIKTVARCGGDVQVCLIALRQVTFVGDSKIRFARQRRPVGFMIGHRDEQFRFVHQVMREFNGALFNVIAGFAQTRRVMPVDDKAGKVNAAGREIARRTGLIQCD